MSRRSGRALRALGALTVSIFSILQGAGLARAAEKPPAATPEERAAALARPALVYISVEWQGFIRNFRTGYTYPVLKSFGRCTGFVVSPDGSIVTAGHCVDPSRAATRFFSLAVEARKAGQTTQGSNNNPFVDPNTRYATWDDMFNDLQANGKLEGSKAADPPNLTVSVIRGIGTSGRPDGEKIPARVVNFLPLKDGDVALLKVEKDKLPSVELAPKSEIQIGTPVLAIGYPGSVDSVTDTNLEPSNKDGKISSKKTSGGVPFYEISAATSPGMSGGPVVDLEGRVVGLISFGPNAETQAFNFIVASSIIADSLTRNGMKAQLGPVDRDFRVGLAKYYEGKYKDAIKSFDKVLGVVPSHQQAQEYRQRAVEASPSSDGGSFPVVPVLLGLALVCGGALFMHRRRSIKKAKPGLVGVGVTIPAASASSPGVLTATLAPLVQSTTAPAPASVASEGGVPAEPAIVRLVDDLSMPVESADAPSPAATTAVAAPTAALLSHALPETATSNGAGATPVPTEVGGSLTVGDRAATPRFCSGCGAERQPGADFCGHCGARLA